MITTTLAGLRRAAQLPRLALLLWLLNLVLAAAAAVPGWLALSSAIGPLPEADRLGAGFDFLVLSDLVQMRPGLLGGLLLSALGLAGLGLLAGNLATGGALEVLRGGDERPLGHRFGRGAFRFFGRFLRVGLVALALGGLLIGLVIVPFALVARRAGESSWEPARFANGLAGGCVVFVVVLLVLMTLDAARILIVRDDARRVWPALRAGARAVFRHPAQWLGTWLVNGLLLGAMLALYLAIRGAAPAAPLWSVFALQQAFVLTRSFLRVALLASEAGLVERLAPPPPQPREAVEASPAAAVAAPTEPVEPAAPAEPEAGNLAT